MHREHTQISERNPSQRGLSIAIWCALAIAALVLYSRSKSGVALIGADQTMIGCLLAGFAGTVSLFAYLLSRKSGRIQSSGFWLLIEGLATLVPPCVIAIAILPITPEARPWIMGLVFAVGCFGLIAMSDIEFADGRDHKFHRREYLFDRGLGQPFLETIDVVDPQTNLPHRRRRGEAESRRGSESRYDDRSATRSTTQSGLQASQHAVSGQPTAARTPEIDGTLHQQISRYTTRAGDDRVEAIWNVVFERDQKRTVVHVPFSPAFNSRPKVECSVIDGDGVTLKVAEIHPYGVRIEARRSNTNQAATVQIGFHATARATSQSGQPASRQQFQPQTTRQSRPGTVSTTNTASRRAVGRVSETTHAAGNITGDALDTLGRGATRATRGVANTIGGVTGSVANAAGATTDRLANVAGGITGGVMAGASGLSRGMTGAVDGVANTVGGVTGAVGSAAGSVTNAIGSTASGVTGGMMDVADGVTGAIGSGLMGAGNMIAGGASGASDLLAGGAENVGGAIAGSASAVTGVGKSLLNKAKRVAQQAADAATDPVFSLGSPLDEDQDERISRRTRSQRPPGRVTLDPRNSSEMDS